MRKLALALTQQGAAVLVVGGATGPSQSHPASSRLSDDSGREKEEAEAEPVQCQHSRRPAHARKAILEAAEKPREHSGRSLGGVSRS